MEEAELSSKISNMFIMLLYAISKEDLRRVKQYLSDSLYKHYESVVQNNIESGVIQKYGEPNVASIRVTRSDDLIEAKLVVKYMDYKVDRNTKKYISGNNSSRESHQVTLAIKQNFDDEQYIYRCKGCGAGLDINLTGVCSYCGHSLDDKESAFVITSIY